MALTLMKKSDNTDNNISRCAVEGNLLLKRIFEHDEERGAKSELTLGQPESCKTAVTCTICNYFMNHYPEDYLFWRSALNAPIQIFKLPRWHIYVERDSGIHFFNRVTGEDITEDLIKKKKVTYFKTFNDLLKKAKSGICNGVFFKDLHYKKIKIDEGTLQWFHFIRHLLHKITWYHVFLDEYQEMVKAGNGEQMYWEIDRHSNDISSARKSNVGVHANAHQTTEVDWRVIPSFMLILQMYGSRVYKHSPVNKTALSSLNKPSTYNGAEAWISEGGHFGRVKFTKIYALPSNMSIEARIINSDEKTKVCPICHHIFRYRRIDQMFCSRACQEKDHRMKKQQK
jgi:hypothetical protein